MDPALSFTELHDPEDSVAAVAARGETVCFASMGVALHYPGTWTSRDLSGANEWTLPVDPLRPRTPAGTYPALLSSELTFTTPEGATLWVAVDGLEKDRTLESRWPSEWSGEKAGPWERHPTLVTHEVRVRREQGAEPALCIELRPRPGADVFPDHAVFLLRGTPLAVREAEADVVRMAATLGPVDMAVMRELLPSCY